MDFDLRHNMVCDMIIVLLPNSTYSVCHDLIPWDVQSTREGKNIMGEDGTVEIYAFQWNVRGWTLQMIIVNGTWNGE